MPEWLSDLFNAERLQMVIGSHGLWVMAPIIFAETGLLIGFVLPGDSLLFLAGAAAAALSAGRLNPWSVIVVLTIAAILGNTVNYWLGRWLGEWLANRNGRLLKRKHLDDAHAFYERWGGLSLVLTRYIPMLRTFVPFAAGAARMHFGRYMLWNVVGALTWVPVLVALGWWLGELRFVKKHIEVIVLSVIAISVAPIVIAALLRWNRRPPAQTPAP